MARDVAVVVLLHVALACVIGLLLPHVADLPVVTRTAEGASTPEVEVAKRFNDDGWLIVSTAVAGLALGMLLQSWRNTNDVVTVVAITLSALLAAVLAGWLAHATGPGDPAAVLAEASVGATAPVPVEIDARVAYLVWPLAAVLGALAALVSPPARGPGDQESRHSAPSAKH
jgi:hypothetical protein